MIIRKFEEQVQRYGDKPAIIIKNKTITFTQLNRFANRVAAELNAEAVPAEKRQAALLFKHGPDMITGLIATLKARMIYVPVDRTHPENRLRYILEDADISVILAHAETLSLARRLVAQSGRNIRVIDINNLPANHPEENPQRTVSGETPAYILYTSGSTGQPKGVLQNHENLYYYARNWLQRFNLTGDDRMTLLTSFVHDGAEQDIWSALLAGATLYPYDVKDILNQNAGLSQYVDEHHITIWHSVPTLFRYFAESLEPDRRFPHLRYILLGGEPLRLRDFEVLEQNFPGALLANVYGQTESSVDSIIIYRPGQRPGVPLLGEPLDRTEILLVDDNDDIVEDIGAGEIVIACDHIALGYWRDPEKSEENFTDDPDTGRLYWTGDLGAMTEDGQIELLGRKDFQVKIRGFRVETGEIESILLKHDDIIETVVSVKQDHQNEHYLCCYFTFSRSIDVNRLRDYLLHRIPDYMVPKTFMPLDQMPLTASGKIDRKALPEAVPEESTETFVPPEGETETQLAQIWSAELKTPLEQVGRHSNFFQLGGHSLKAINLIAQIHKQFQVRLELEDIFTHSNLCDMAGCIDDSIGSEAIETIPPVEEREYYPLSSAQERLFILLELEPESTAYNLFNTVDWPGEVDIPRLEAAIQQVIRRHESFRTSFLTIRDQPVQQIHPDVPFQIDYFDLSDRDEETLSLRQFFVKPFDLSKAPLFRMAIVKLPGGHHRMLLDMHHIITDGTSMAIFVREFKAIYENRTLSPLPRQYKDYSQWQQSPGWKTGIQQQAAYWLERFSGELQPADLPYDFPRPAMQRFDGEKIRFLLTQEMTQQLKSLAAQASMLLDPNCTARMSCDARNFISSPFREPRHGAGTTMYMLLLAVVNILLYKLTGRGDITVGSPVAGRKHPELEGIIGMLVNTLALRNFPHGDKTFPEFLAEVRQSTIEAFQNQDYPFEELVDTLSPNRDLGRNPLFDVMLVFHSEAESMLEDSPWDLKEETIRDTVSMFDMTIHAIEVGPRLGFSWEYCTALFRESTIQRFIHYFKNILTFVLADPSVLLSHIDYIPQEELNDLLYKFNDTDAGYPQDKTVHGLFEEQASRLPGAVALVDPETNHHITYHELNRRAEHLAASLQARGVVPGTIIALLLKPSPEMLIAILGTLKSGGAYLPMDPDYPEERIRYMLRDSQSPITLTIDDISPKFDSTVPNLSQSATNPCYIIYTSGTTGRPKGAIIEHRNVVRLLFNDRNLFDFTHRDTWTLFHSYCFDFSVWEMYGALLYGGKLIIIPRTIARDTVLFLETLKKQNVTVLNQTPGAFYNLSNCETGHPRKDLHIRYIVFGGEALAPARLRDWYDRYPSTRLINMYGITETTVHVTFKEIREKEITDNISNIGVPIPTLKTYILDKHFNPVPTGVPGELIVAGHGVGRGYLNNPELTSHKFSSFQVKSFWESRTLFAKRVLAAGGKLYKSGDLARWNADGEMEYLGRIDSQVKIRGFRIELGEIESRLLSHAEVKEAVVLARTDVGGDHYLCAYVVGEVEGLNQYLNRFLPDYMIPSYFIPLEKIPLTSNGKIHRKALPEPEIGDPSGPEPRDRIEKALASVWREVLNIPEQKSLGIDSGFFKMGGHSLKATIMAARVHREHNVKIPLVQVFKTPTIRGLADYIKTAATETHRAVKQVEERPYYPLSSAQKRLFIIQQLEEESTGYNMPIIVKLTGHLEVDRLTHALRQLIQRHDILRTSYRLIDGTPVQQVHEQVDFSLEDFSPPYVLSDPSVLLDLSSLYRSFVRPFDLTQAPMLRAGLAPLPGDEYVFMLDIHHIASDGISSGILISDLMALYDDKKLPRLTLRYRDYACWQGNPLQQAAVNEQEKFWLEQFAGEIPVLNLPLDKPRPSLWRYDGGRVDLSLDHQTTQALENMAGQENTTLYILLLAVYNVFLSRLTGQEDIVVGTPTAGRRHADLEGIVGMFANTLALRNYPGWDQSFRDFLAGVNQRTLQAYENQDYQFETLVETLSLQRDTGRNPVFDAMLVLQDIDRQEIQLEDLRLSPYPMEEVQAKFDLNLIARPGAGGLHLTLEYCTALFNEDSPRRFIHYFKILLDEILINPGQSLSMLEMIPPQEKQRILEDFNGESIPYPDDTTLHGIFERQVEATPDVVALVYPTLTITYRELNRRAGLLADYLIQKGTGQNDIIAIMVEPSIQMAVGLLGILKSGAAYLPIDPGYPQERVDYIMTDSNASLLLTNDDIVQSQKIPPDRAAGRACRAPTGGLAYVIYTSGSTGRPKGVMVEHRQVGNNFLVRRDIYNLNPGVVSIQLLSFVFDGFVASFFTPLHSGSRSVMPDRETIPDASRVKELIQREQVDYLCSVPSFFNTLMDTFGGTPISSLKQVTLAGEKLSPVLLDKIKQTQPHIEIVNEFGVTEASVSSTHLRHQERFPYISIGKPNSNTRISILNRAGQLQPIGVPGELYIEGPGVARGYLNHPELTHEKFVNSKLYKSGDSARWLPDGNIDFLGRIDFQVKIRGYRIETGEIENRLLSHPDVQKAVVMARTDSSGDHYLCAYIVGNEPGLKEYLRQTLPGYMIPAYIIPVEDIPLTFSGKPDRKALPDPGGVGDTAGPGPRDAVEKTLAEVWREVLNIPPDTPIGIDTGFFEIGGHSLKATMMAAKVHRALDVKIPLVQIFTTPTIRGLGDFIKTMPGEKYRAVGQVEERPYYPLSSAQKRLYVLQRLEKESTGYNMPLAVKLEGHLDTVKLTHALRSLIQRHEILRTTYQLIDGEPVQQIHRQVDFSLEDVSPPYVLSDPSVLLDLSPLYRSFIRPFDLTQAPMLRAGLARLSDREYIFILDMHHIASDGVSTGILTQEFMALYNGDTLPPLKRRYRDYACWQNSPVQREVIKQQEKFWLEQFSGEIPVLDLPADFPRPVVRRYDGSRVDFRLDAGKTKQLKQLVEKEKTTLFIVLLAIYNVFLHRLTNQEDIVVGTPVAGRRHADLEGVVGMFANTLALRNYPGGDVTFTHFLQQVKERTLQAYENQDYQFEELVEAAAVERDTGRNPVFDAMLVLQNIDSPDIHVSGLRMSGVPAKGTVAKFDLTLSARDGEGEGLFFGLEYSTVLFKEETILRFIQYFKTLLESIPVDPSQPLGMLNILPDDERKQILEDFNHTAEPYPFDKTVSQLFEEQAASTPELIALVSPSGETVTYGQLDNRVNTLAGQLIQKGLGTGGIAALLMESSIQLVTGMLAILKTSAAFLPIDPNYPKERIDYIISDSNASLLLTGNDIVQSEPATRNPSPAGRLNSATNLCYIIYTSGTTGRPKGVPITHRSLVNLCYWHNRAFSVTSADRSVQYASPGFDASIWEIFPYLLCGAAVYIPPADTKPDMTRLNNYFEENRITVTFLPTPACEQFMELENRSLRFLLTGGDKLKRYIKRNYTLVNNYGPTENTVVSTSFIIEGDHDNIPIGRPVSNNKIYIIDSHGNPQPIGVPGELCVAGDGLSPGYLNNPELTAQKFINSKFKIQNSKLYKSGDLCRWLPDGNIEFLGRVDRQVKIRGFRIELAEIENRILSHPGISDAVVLALSTPQSEKYLCAYIVGQDAQILEYLSQSLPHYMIPSYIIPIEKIPLTPNGKIDQKALPSPAEIEPGSLQHREPQTDVEKKIIEICSTILPTSQIPGMEDNLFQMGANSLSLIKLVSGIHREFQVEIPIMMVFRDPRPGALAGYVTDKKYFREDDEPFVEFNPSGEETLFCFPPGVGYGVSYMVFAPLLERYRLVSFNYIHAENRVERYVDIIKQHQPRGPYRFLAYSAGGELAVQVTNRLEQEGFEVSDILFLDCRRTRRDSGDQRIEPFIENVIEELESLGIGFLRDRVRQKVMDYLQYLSGLPTLEPVNAAIHLVTSDDLGEEPGEDNIPGWQDLALKLFIRHKGKGKHAEMITRDCARYNADLVKEIISRGRIDSTSIKVHQRLSPVYGNFLQYAKEHPGALEHALAPGVREDQLYYRFQPWPVFLDTENKRKFQQAAVKVFDLIKTAPNRVFGDDLKAMSDFFGIPGVILKRQLDGITGASMEHLVARGDFMLTGDGLKCLEFNVAGNIGGLEMSSSMDEFLNKPYMKEFLQQHHVQLDTETQLERLFRHIVEIARHDGEINTALVLRGSGLDAPPGWNYEPLKNYYKQTLAGHTGRVSGHTGELTVCDFQHFTTRNGDVYLGDKKIHVIMENYQGMVPPELLEMSRNGAFVLLIGPVTGLLSNKLILALLSQHQDSPLFTPAEQETIRRYIPWTRKLEEHLKTEILENQAKLVIKPAAGMGGDEVYMGSSTPVDIWHQAVEKGIRDGKWLAQEKVNPELLLFHSNRFEVEPHHVVWGLYVFGNKYGGAITRGQPYTGKDSVINAQQGAWVGTVLEEKD